MKVWNYIIMFVVISVLMFLAGIEITGVTNLLIKIGILQEGAINLDSNNTFRTTAIALLALAVGAGLIIGFITKSQSENFIILPFITGTGIAFGLFVFINLGYSIINYGFTQADWIGYITLVIFAPLTIGFIVSLIEFFRGTD